MNTPAHANGLLVPVVTGGVVVPVVVGAGVRGTGYRVVGYWGYRDTLYWDTGHPVLGHGTALNPVLGHGTALNPVLGHWETLYWVHWDTGKPCTGYTGTRDTGH